MPLAAPLLETRLNGLAPHRQGKVRDIFDLGDALLMVATDRISAFDYVLGSGIPDKGKVLTQLSAFWFEHTRRIVAESPADDRRARRIPTSCSRHADVLAGRSMLVRKTNPVPIECVARGYLSGSGWKEYQATGAVCGVALPPGLRESDRLPAADLHAGHQGHHRPRRQHQRGRGRPSSSAQTLVATLRELTLALYAFGAAHAESRGIILADTKFEFGLTDDGEVILIDEVMTPDSSRYWPQDQYDAGRAAAELRQAVRARLPRADPLEQAAAGPVAARRRRRAHAREIPRSVPPPDRARNSPDAAAENSSNGSSTRWSRKGVRYDGRAAGVREEVHRPRPVQADGNLGKAADLLGMHRNTLSRKMTEYRLRAAPERRVVRRDASTSGS